jgi:RimJ/RimL family protein N-acetyltransferase
MTDSLVLRTARLTLSPITAADFDDLYAVWSDPDFVRHITGVPLTPEECWFRLLRDVGHWAVVGYGNWAMRLSRTGEYVGSIGVLDFRRDTVPVLDAPELGWGVAPGFQGRGFGVEGVSAALAWADVNLPGGRTVCMISPPNEPSLRLAERVGYRPYTNGTYKEETVILLERMSA